MMTDKWPIGCIHPNSCARSRRCQYIGCRHAGRESLPLSKEMTEAETKAKAPKVYDYETGYYEAGFAAGVAHCTKEMQPLIDELLTNLKELKAALETRDE